LTKKFYLVLTTTINKKGELDMTQPTLGKKGKSTHESMHSSTSDMGKKKWQSPELTEVDYDKTNFTFSGGSGSDGVYYS
jgi:hypothetical protein